MDSTADVIVVGAGVLGLSAAWSLTRLGRRVVCLDRTGPGREASGTTAGTLAIQNKRPPVIPLTVRSIRLWETLAEELGADVAYEKRGGLQVAHSDEDLEQLERACRVHGDLGAPVELIRAPELHRRWPYLAPGVQAATYCPDDGMANPFATVRAYYGACRRAGVRFELGRQVDGIEAHTGGGFTVRAGPLTASSDAVLLAAGAWIPVLTQMVGLTLPLYPKLQQVLVTQPGPILFREIVTHIGGRLTLKQQSDTGKVLVGGGWRGTGPPEPGQHRLDRANMVSNLKLALATIPGLAPARLMRGWSGIEGRSPDRLPVLGPVGQPPGLHLLGCSAGGFTLSPILGRIAAEIIADERVALSYGEFGVGRFARTEGLSVIG